MSIPQYGGATVRRNEGGSLTVENADNIIGISTELLVQGATNLIVDGDGNLLLACDPNWRYQPIAFTSFPDFGPVSVVVCKRVEGETEVERLTRERDEAVREFMDLDQRIVPALKAEIAELKAYLEDQVAEANWNE